jgi:hypothetical protein
MVFNKKAAKIVIWINGALIVQVCTINILKTSSRRLFWESAFRRGEAEFSGFILP